MDTASLVLLIGTVSDARRTTTLVRVCDTTHRYLNSQTKTLNKNIYRSSLLPGPHVQQYGRSLCLLVAEILSCHLEPKYDLRSNLSEARGFWRGPCLTWYLKKKMRCRLKWSGKDVFSWARPRKLLSQRVVLEHEKFGLQARPVATMLSRTNQGEKNLHRSGRQ